MKKVVFTSQLGKYVARDARTGQFKSVHVVSRASKGWVVVRDGSDRSLKSFSRKESAISFAREYVISNKGNEIVIHDKNGKIASRRSYGNKLKKG